MFVSRSFQHPHRTHRGPLSVGRLGVNAGHITALPSEDGIQLFFGGAVVGRGRRADLANTMGGLAEDASRIASLAEHVAEGRFHKRPTLGAADKRQVSARAGRERRREHGQDRQRDRHRELALFRRQ